MMGAMNPRIVRTAVSAAVLAVLLSGCGDADPREAIASATAGVNGAIEKANELKDEAEKRADEIQEQAEDAKQKVDDAKQSVEDAVGSAKDALDAVTGE